MNRAALKSVVRANLGNRQDKDTLIEQALNAAIRHMCQRYQFRGLTEEQFVTCTIGSSQVALPISSFQITGLTLIDGTRSYSLDLRPKTQVLRGFPNAVSYPMAHPVAAYEEAGSIYVFPRPNKAYQIRVQYLRQPDELASDADSIEIQGVDTAACNYATAHVMRSLEKFQEAGQWDQQFEREFASAIAADRRQYGTKRNMEMRTRGGVMTPIEQYGEAFAGHKVSRY